MKKIFCAGKTAIMFVSLLCGALFLACDQEPLFWDIAHEYPPISPAIGGRPTRIAEIGTKLYVSNNSDIVWAYDTAAAEPLWERMEGTDKPSFRVEALASAGTELFALDRDGAIWKHDVAGSGWNKTSYSNGYTEKLFGAGDYLFVSVLTGNLEAEYGYEKAYTIQCLDMNGDVLSEIPDTGLLMGAEAVGGKIYLGTLGGGLYSGTGTVFVKDTGNFEEDETVVGLSTYNNTLFVVNPTEIFSYNGAVKIRVGGGTHFTGAAAGWTDGTNHLLLVGLQYGSGSYGYGYREIQIDTSGNPLSGLEIPGEGDFSSTDQDSQYVSAIGKNAITYFYVCNGMTKKADLEDRPVVFACTFKDGLWSYRTRNGEAQWNGEDRTGY